MTLALSLALTGFGAVALGHRIADRATEPTTRQIGGSIAVAGVVLAAGAAVGALAVAVL